jgi:hypothetical protein
MKIQALVELDLNVLEDEDIVEHFLRENDIVSMITGFSHRFQEDMMPDSGKHVFPIGNNESAGSITFTSSE